MANQELIQLITREVLRQLEYQPQDQYQAGPANTPVLPFPSGPRRIPVAISARYVHLCQEHIDVLFGPGHRITPVRDLPQPGEFVATETVTLVGPRQRAIENVRVLGAVRSFTQVEISRADARTLGINPPVRRSGDLKDTPGLTLIGPAGTLILEEGVIIANRHIHMNPDDAAYFGVQDNEEVDVRVVSAKPTILGQVQIRVGRRAVLYMHLDTDDANAAAIDENAAVEILKPEVSQCCWQ